MIKNGIQYPNIKDNWLYQNDEQGNRQFTDSVALGKGAQPWHECTNKEKEDWEKEHNPQYENIEEAKVI